MAIANSVWSFLVSAITIAWGSFIAWHYFRVKDVDLERTLVTVFVLILFQIVDPKGFKKAKEFIVLIFDLYRGIRSSTNKKDNDSA